jgi:CO/xanthine dehydrogenase Mo-binding subunit
VAEETLPPRGELAAWLREQPGEAFAVVDGTPAGAAEALDATAVWTHQASYSRPYLMHGSIGPSAAMALWQDGRLEVWSHSQGVFVLREALAQALELAPQAIRVRHVVGPGCYGHNGADDAAFDAALLALAVPGRAVLLKWSRSDEHQWEPYGSPALVELRATLDERGRIAEWSHDVWGTTHIRRPMVGGSANLLAGAHLDPPLPARPPGPFLVSEAGIHRNATPIYETGRRRIVKHFVPAMPLRTSSLRSLGAYANVFAIESFMDELAAIRGVSPLELRLEHLGDQRARDVLLAAVEAAAWSGAPSEESGRGCGIALATRTRPPMPPSSSACASRTPPRRSRSSSSSSPPTAARSSIRAAPSTSSRAVRSSPRAGRSRSGSTSTPPPSRASTGTPTRSCASARSRRSRPC